MEEGRYLRDVVSLPMGGQRGGPHRLVNPKTITKFLMHNNKKQKNIIFTHQDKAHKQFATKLEGCKN